MAYTTINKPSEYFNTKLYTGNGSSGNAQTGIGFQPDWVWIKDRGQVAGHQIFDSVRGATKRIQSNSAGAEVTNDGVSSFDSDGFTLGANSSCNENSQNFVAWNWLGGGTGVSNTQGDITSTVSANTTSGFSIVSYTGTGANATVGHGLSATPKMIILKDRNGTNQWGVYNANIGATKYLLLETTGGAGTASTLWNNTEPTSSVFTVGTTTTTNGSGLNYIAYCFAEKKGYSKFGSYVGNGNADGTFVYTGFKPAWIMVKRTSTAGENWNIRDNKRSPINPANNNLPANDSRAEEPYYATDLLSNGFKIRTLEGGHNTNGGTYIYMAFAENPLVGTNGVPATAR